MYKNDPNLRFVQIEYPQTNEDCFDICFIYSFFVDFKNVRNGKPSRLKYIIRAEKFEDVFAIKFYASRDRKTQYDKYSLAHGDIDVAGILKIFRTCVTIMQKTAELYPGTSFLIKGAESYDIRSQREEDEKDTQRFRIYRNYLSKRIGKEKYYHSQHPSISVYQLIYKDEEDYNDKALRHLKMFYEKFGANDFTEQA